jgi:uncharacterized membrane protein YqjE
MSEPAAATGLFSSLRRLVGTALELAQVRLELLSTEVEREKLRVFDGLFWAALALLLLSVGVALLCAFIVLLFWDGYRLPAVGVLTVLFIGGGFWVTRIARQHLQSPGGMFATSSAELARDRSGLDVGEP